MSPRIHSADETLSLINYLQFVSDMLGGDLFPLDRQSTEVRTIISHRAIDYELIVTILREILQHNVVFHKTDTLSAYPTLDALGQVRKRLLERRGDIHQISLVDRIGELTVSFFNLAASEDQRTLSQAGAKLYRLRDKQ